MSIDFNKAELQRSRGAFNTFNAISVCVKANTYCFGFVFPQHFKCSHFFENMIHYRLFYRKSDRTFNFLKYALSRLIRAYPTVRSCDRIKVWFKNDSRKKEAYQRTLQLHSLCLNEFYGPRQYRLEADCRHTFSRKYVTRRRAEIQLLRVVGGGSTASHCVWEMRRRTLTHPAAAEPAPPPVIPALTVENPYYAWLYGGRAGACESARLRRLPHRRPPIIGPWCGDDRCVLICPRAHRNKGRVVINRTGANYRPAPALAARVAVRGLFSGAVAAVDHPWGGMTRHGALSAAAAGPATGHATSAPAAATLPAESSYNSNSHPISECDLPVHCMPSRCKSAIARSMYMHCRFIGSACIRRVHALWSSRSLQSADWNACLMASRCHRRPLRRASVDAN